VLARRIGFSPDSSPLLALHDGETAAFDPVLRTFAVQLSTVRVDVTERCRIAPEAGALAQQLWEDAQSALTATVLGGSDGESAFLLRRFERELDSAGQTVRATRTWDAITRTSEPYTSIAAESLAAHGFVVPQGSALVYYAPDARTLISDAFARGHCFRPIERDDHPGEIGLAFEPTARVARKRRDVSGALWIDRATGRLLDLELTYAVPPELGSLSVPAASARVDYGRTPSGRWVVKHWVLRMPVVTMRGVTAPRSGSSLQVGAVLAREQVPTLAAIWEDGGDVVRTLAGADTVLDAVGTVSGRFVDSVRHGGAGAGARLAGVAGIRVHLEAHAGTIADARYAAVSDSTGAFTIGSVRPGQYTVRVEGALLDTLDVAVPPRDITVAAATTQSLVTTIPPMEALVRNLCPDGLAPSDAVLHGTVAEADGRPNARARVVVSWFDVSDDRASHFGAHAETRGAATDRNGGWVVCGVPRNRRLSVQAISGTRKSELEDVLAADTPIRLVTFTMPGSGAAP
jgi:hypothetical protein